MVTLLPAVRLDHNIGYYILDIVIISRVNRDRCSELQYWLERCPAALIT